MKHQIEVYLQDEKIPYTITVDFCMDNESIKPSCEGHAVVTVKKCHLIKANKLCEEYNKTAKNFGSAMAQSVFGCPECLGSGFEELPEDGLLDGGEIYTDEELTPCKVCNGSGRIT